MSSVHEKQERLQSFVEEWPVLRDTVADARKRAGDLDLLTLDLPKRLGGDGLSCTELVPLFVAVGSHDANLRDYLGLGHAGLFLQIATRRFDAVLKANGRGEAFTAVAITEEAGGSDLKALKTRAEYRDCSYVLNGRKAHVSRLEAASDILVFAQVIRDGNAHLTCFLVPRWSPGLAITSRTPIGLDGQSWGDLTLTDVTIPAKYRVGGEGEGFSLFRKHFARWRLFMAAIALGVGQSALAWARERLRTRTAFGGRIGRFTHNQQAYAKHAAALHAFGRLLMDAAEKIDRGEAAAFHGCVTKAEIVEAARAAVDFAVSVHGAEGVTQDHPVRKMHDHLDALRMADGTTEVLRGQAARVLLGEDLYRESLGQPQDNH